MRELWKRFQKTVFGFALVEAQFESIMAFKDLSKHNVDLELLFEILDYNHDGRIDGLELLGGLALCCQASFEDKARFCFEMYDFNLNASMSPKEMTIMIMASLNGMVLLTDAHDGGHIPTLKELDTLVSDAFERADKNKTGCISFEDFLGWARSNREIMAAVENLSKISQQAKDGWNDVDSAADTDEGELSDAEDGCEHGIVVGEEDREGASGGPTFGLFAQWKAQMKQLEPTNYKYSKRSAEGPETNLELCWAHGYRSSSRNNVHYVCYEAASPGADPESHTIVYPTAAITVVYNLETKEQAFYQGHSDEVTCITVHPSSMLVATGDCRGNIHLWDARSREVVFVIKSLAKNGVLHLAYSPSGDRIAVVGADPDHTLTIYSIMMPGLPPGEVISSGKGIASPNNVFDVAFSPGGKEICMVGRKQVLFFRGVDTTRRSLDSLVGRIGRAGKKQTYFCVAYMAEDVAVVGCANGCLYKMVLGACTQVVQAHGMKEPVLALSYNAASGVLLSGGKDSLIRTWDSSLKEVGVPLDMSEDQDPDGKGDAQAASNTAVISVELCRNRVLVATKGCDIFEARMPVTASDGYILTRISSGHSTGSLCGLAAHPSREEFVTVGDDKTLRVWSIRSHEQTASKALLCESRAVCYSPTGEFLAVGMEDGTTALLEARSANLRVCATWKHSAKPITCLRFSPDGLGLAVASRDRNVYLYRSEDKRTFRRQAVCRGHASAVMHLDFSANSQYLQSNSDDLALLLWDLFGNQVKNLPLLRDLQWATYTCPMAWATQGVWQSSPDRFVGVNSCICIPEVEDLVTGDESHRVNLYRYPAVDAHAVYLSYMGHAAPVKKVHVSANRRFVVSIGGNDRTILLWRHEIEDVDETDEETPQPRVGGGYSSDSSGDEGEAVDRLNDFTECLRRSPAQEAMAVQASPAELAALLADDPSASSTYAQWKAAVIEPTYPRRGDAGNDVDLTLKWVHGYRSRDCRNSLRYTSSGRIVYTAASLAVVYSKTTGKQSFLLGAHQEEVMGIAVHPNGKFFATGESGRRPTIIVWDSTHTRVLKRIEGSHENGIPLLAFSTRGNFVASVGRDKGQTLVLHDWGYGIEIMRTPTQRSRISCLAFLQNPLVSARPDPDLPEQDAAAAAKRPKQDIIVTGGRRHLTFWWTQGSNVKSQRALWGKARRFFKQETSCVASAVPHQCVTGHVDGTLIVWFDFRAVSDTLGAVPMGDGTAGVLGTGAWERWNLGVPYPHKASAILSMWAVPGEGAYFVDDCEHNHDLPTEAFYSTARYITGDHDGHVVVWRLCRGHAADSFHLRPLQLLDLRTLSPAPMSLAVRSVCERDGMLLIGTQGGEIYEVAQASIEFLQSPAGARSLLSDPTASRKAPSAAAVPLEKVSAPVDSHRLLASHAKGEVWALAAHPYLPIAFTAGDDHTLRCWSLVEHKMLCYTALPQKCRAIDVDPADGKELVACMSDGQAWVLRAASMANPRGKPNKEVDLKQNGDELRDLAHMALSSPPLHSSQVARFAFDGSVLAIGCHDKKIYLYSVGPAAAPAAGGASAAAEEKAGAAEGAKASSGWRSYTFLASLEGHHAYVTHLDFGVGLVTTKTVMQLYDKNAHAVLSLPAPKRAPSAGHGVAGGAKAALASIAEDSKEGGEDKPASTSRPLAASDLCLMSTSIDKELLFWSCRTGAWLKVDTPAALKDAWWSTWSCPYGWPVQGIWPAFPDGSDVCAVARPHAFEAIPVVASADTYGRLRLFSYPCVSQGSPDKCYRGHTGHITNMAYSNDDSCIVTTGGADRCVFVWGTDILDEIRERRALSTGSLGGDGTSSREALAQLAAAVTPSEDVSSFLPLKALMTPCAPLRPPLLQPWRSMVREPSEWSDPPNSSEPPASSLELKFAYGYRGYDCRGNIGFAGSTSMIVYPVGGVGVSYNADTHRQVHNLEHAQDIICLAMSPHGHTVATGEIAPRPRIVIWDAITGATISTLIFHRVGVNNLVWSNDGELLVSTGLDPEHTICVHSVGTGAVVGTGKAGAVALLTVAMSSDNKFLTGGHDHIKFWDVPPCTMAGGMLGVKSGIYNTKGNSCRTVVSSAYLGVDAVTGMSNGMLLLWKERSSSKFVQAHMGPVLTLCTLPDTTAALGAAGESGPRVVSGGRDGMVHVWSYKLNKMWSLSLVDTTPTSCLPQVHALAVQENQMLIGTAGSELYQVDLLSSEVHQLVCGHYLDRAEVWGLACHPSTHRFVTTGDDLWLRLWDGKTFRQLALSDLGAKCRCVAYKPDASQIVAATMEGKLAVLSPDLRERFTEVTVCSSGIRCLAFSPDGTWLAAGASDAKIYILDTKHFSCRATCRGHTSHIRSIDFSADSRHLQSSSASYELLFWDVTGKPVHSPGLMRDAAWHFVTCTFGWGVQGLHSLEDPGTVHAVRRSPDGSLLVCGEGRRLKLLSYPALEGARFKEYRGHCDDISNVAVSFDGKYVYSAGGLDKSVLQYEVKRQLVSKPAL